MTAMLTADWFLLGRDTYYRKFEIYSMHWHKNVNMDKVAVSGASYGGPIAIIRDPKKFVKVQGAGKPMIAIYSGSGKQISSLMWKHNQPITIGWSHQEHLLCVQDDGSVHIHDMFGNFKHKFSIEKQTDDVKVIDAKIFSSPQGTGVAILTSSFRVIVINNIYDVRTRQLSKVPSSCDQPARSWAVIPGERQTEVLIARGKDIYLLRADESHGQRVPFPITHEHTAIIEIAVSLNAKHVVFFTDGGYLWLGPSDLRFKYCEIRTECATPPKQLMWCGNEAVVLYHNYNVSVYGKQDADEVTYAYDGAVHLVNEIDGVRVLSGGQHEMIQKVPDVVQKIFRINSTDPGSFLLEASKQYQKRSHRADEYISLVKDELELAVQQCVTASGYEFDTDVQKMLIRAAQFGKCFLANMDPNEYVNMCRELRVLNAVRDSRIGIPLTYEQARALTYEVLLERLVARKHFYLAIQVARFLRLPESEGSSRILERWAKYKVVQAVQLAQLDQDVLAREIADKVGYAPTVSFSEIARTAVNCGHKRLAIRLLDYEPRARRQVPLLLELGETRQALVKAIESGDTDLIYTVIISMRESMPLADFRLTLRDYPTAQALYKKYCQKHNPQALEETHLETDNFCAQADSHLRSSLDPAITTREREASLAAAAETYRKGRNELHASLCDEAHRLLRAQKNYADLYHQSFYDLSVHETCAKLLSIGQFKAADKFRADFKIPERRYWWLRIRDLAQKKFWDELEKLSKSKKSPIGYGPFVDVCLENSKTSEAIKYLPKVAEDLKIKYYIKAGQFEDAARIAFEQKNAEGLLYLQRICAGQTQIVDTVNKYIAQLNSRK